MSRTPLSNLERARCYLSKIPGAVSGQGGNDQTWDAMLAIAGFSLMPDEAWELAKDYNARCQPSWNERELMRKLDEAHTRARVPAGRFVNGKRSESYTWTTSAEKASKPAAVVLLPEPVQMPDEKISPAETLRDLFRPGELLRVVREARQDESGSWKPASKGRLVERDELADLLERDALGENTSAGAWIGINPQRDESATDAGVLDYRYLLLESDSGSLEQQMAIIQETALPVAAVVDSGKKSLHAWIKLDAPNLDEYRRRVALVYALPLLSGFDPQNKNPGRLTRLPGARRGEKVQRVVARHLGSESWEAWEKAHSVLPEPVEPERDEAWPFVCVGYNEGKAYLRPNDTRQIQAVTYDKLTSKAAMLGIHSDGGWWASRFPTDEGGAPDWSKAGKLIRERCISAGVYVSGQDKERGRGIWEDGGCIVANPGGSWLNVDGKRVPASWTSPIGRLYVPGAQLPFSDTPLSDESAKLFIDLLTVCLRDRVAARLLAGWVMNAPLLGTLRCRPSLWITGERGGGKSYLLRIINQALGDFAPLVSIGTTEAALRQSLGKGDALPFIYDEAESDDEKGQDGMQRILGFVRAGYDEDGQNISKGGASGNSVSYRSRTCGLFASIHPCLARGRDAARFVLLEVRQLATEERQQRNAESARLSALTIEAPSFQAMLAARAVAVAKARRANAVKIAIALTRLDDDRARRKWGELLAGAEAMEHTRELTEQEARQIADAFDPTRYAAEQEKDSEKLLQKILTSSWCIESGEPRTVSTLLREAYKDRDDSETTGSAAKALERLGLKWNRDGDLAIGTAHEGLLKLLHAAPWQGDSKRIARELATMPGAVAKSGKGLRIGKSYKGAGVVIPQDRLAEFMEMPDPF